MYTAQSYTLGVKPILGRYKADNVWVKWWKADDIDNVKIGWRMYEKAAKNALGFLLLGDTAIRTNKALLLNFGLTTAHGVQEQKDIAMIEQIMDQRRAFATPAKPASKAVEILGPGSILSDKEWTPLLNDSFVLGGVNACQEFHLADDAFHTFTPKAAAPPSLVAQRRAVFGEAAKGYAPNLEPAKEKWKAYFQANPSVFWGSWGAPRVFAREVIGMKTFGYKPVYTMHELAFDCVDPGRAMGATFAQYLDALSAVNFGAPNRADIMGAISEYMFGAKGILT